MHFFPKYIAFIKTVHFILFTTGFCTLSVNLLISYSLGYMRFELLVYKNMLSIEKYYLIFVFPLAKNKVNALISITYKTSITFEKQNLKV